MKTLKIIIALITGIFFINTIPSQWQELNSGISKKLNYCKIFTGNITWVCGDSGTVLRSVNNGSSWTNLTGNGIPLSVNLISIGGLNDNALTVGGNNGTSSVIYMSSNQGATWLLTFSQPSGTMRSLSGSIYLGDPVGGRWSIWKSTNYGLSWDSAGMYLPQNASEHGWNNSYYNDGDDYNFTFGTNNYRIYKRSNITWSTVSVPFEQNIYSVLWTSLTYGYIGGDNLWYTSNNGTSWVPAGLPGSGNIISISSQPGLYTAWVIRADNQIYSKEFSGSWVSSYNSPSGIYTNIKLGSSYTNVFALRGNGGISYKNIPPFPLSINQISTEIPEKFLLLQNYPNPFNPVTKIKFDISGSEVAQTFLSVYDILGHEIAILVNQQLQPGSYESAWDASAYPSGMYYYKLEVSPSKVSGRSFTETKKMVLIK